MQVLCHGVARGVAAGGRLGRRGLLALAAFLVMVSAYGQTDISAALQTKLLKEVSQWAQNTHQLEADQFSFAPLDARVQVQTCDRPLVMDLPFATRETVRVRCLGSPYWQLYMRLVLKPGVALSGVQQPLAPAAPVSTPIPVPAKVVASAAPATRKVVVAKQLLRSGTTVSPDLLEEQEVPSQGVDLQAVSSVKDLENGEMVRDMQAGVPLRSHDVRRAILVKQGQLVILTVGQSNGFAISARVEALQDGKMGEQIRLKNPESGRILSGVVTGPNAARGL
jgi:flagella basal body P-ring formation protein FlgA